jgi:hypothetical protein
MIVFYFYFQTGTWSGLVLAVDWAAYWFDGGLHLVGCYCAGLLLGMSGMFLLPFLFCFFVFFFHFLFG